MIYEVMPASGYEDVTCVNEDDYEFINFNGRSLAADWRPVLVQRYATTDHAVDGGDKPADLYRWCGGIVMRSRAVVALRDMLEAGGEILPLATNDGVRLYVFNVTRVLDALDEERSEVLRFDNGDAYHAKAPAFHEDMVRGVDFFILPPRICEVFAGESFVERVHAAGLEGLDLRLVWSPEGGPVRRRLW